MEKLGAPPIFNSEKWGVLKNKNEFKGKFLNFSKNVEGGLEYFFRP